MKKKTIPTLIGIVLLILGLALAVSFVSYRQLFRLGAAGEAAPKDVRISNLTDSSFTASWTTDKATSGFIKYGEGQTSLGKIEKEQIGVAGLTHLVKVSGLNPQSTYFFKINSGGNDFDNNGVVWQAETALEDAISEQKILASGTVLTASGSPAENAIVYLSLNGSLLSTLTSTNGGWLMSLFSDTPINPATTLLEINVQAGAGEIAAAQIYPQSANPTPAIILGEVYDFKSLPPSANNEVPEAELNAPEEEEQASGFNATGETPPAQSKTVTLESLEEGEVVTSTTPEFFGKGPVNTNLTITVESDPVSESITVPNSGEWQWTPPKNLAPGTHKVTLSWKDAAGITRFLTKTFVVQASEGPAFEATPSATLRATPTASPSATLPPQPESGSLTPTLVLFMMGIGAIFFGFFIWQKAEI